MISCDSRRDLADEEDEDGRRLIIIRSSTVKVRHKSCSGPNGDRHDPNGFRMKNGASTIEESDIYGYEPQQVAICNLLGQVTQRVF